MLPSIRLFYLLLSLMALSVACRKEYSFEGDLSSGLLIKDPSNECSLITVNGTYLANNNLETNNFLTVHVRVSRAGTYRIFTDSVNGYSFSTTGKFADTGQITIKLPAIGRPLIPGNDQFRVRYDSSECQVVVQVADPVTDVVQSISPDHFPLTNQNRWIYDDLSYPGDSIITSLNGTSPQNGFDHHVQDEYISFFPATNQNYYRKSGSDYFEFAAVSGYTSALDYAPSIYDDINFLKEGLQTGDNWYSNTYSGRTSLGVQVLVLRYQFICTDADATVTVNGRTFAHVYKVQMKPQVANVGGSPMATGEIYTNYYAKGIGLIYGEFYNGIRTHPERQIRSWQVN